MIHRHAFAHPRHRRSTDGFTIIEMLVALVVIGVAMLGIGRLFLYTLQGNSSATSRTVAVNLAADLADRIRANRSAQIAYAGASPASASSVTCAGGTTINTTPLCTPAQMAAFDLYQWDQQVRCVGAVNGACWAAAPSWTVVYAANATGIGPNSYTITLNWVEQATGQSLTYALVVQI